MLTLSEKSEMMKVTGEYCWIGAGGATGQQEHG
jgi:hypothetical protein